MILKRITILALLLVMLSSCEGDEKRYYKGYHSAWDEKKDEKRYRDDLQYKLGYDKGLRDYGYFNQGCDDARAVRPPNSLLIKHRWYNQGYEECKKRG